MKSVILSENGGIEKLIFKPDLPLPEIKPNEVLVKIEATTVNRADLVIRAGYPGLSLKFPHILGGDITGTIENIGSEVKNFRTGDRIVAWPIIACGECEWCKKGRYGLCFNWNYFGMHRNGSYAEYAAVPESSLVSLPHEVSFETAACLPVAGLTAFHALNGVGNLQKGDTFFIWGGTSGLGMIAVQIAKNLGAKIFATAGNEHKMQMLRDMEADYVFNHYTNDDIHDEVLKLTDHKGIDVVLDYIGPATHERSFRIVKKGGKILWCGIMTGRETTVSIHQTYLRHISLLGLYLGEKHELEALVKLCAERKVKPHIHGRLNLKDAGEAHRLMMEGKIIGKILLIP